MDILFAVLRVGRVALFDILLHCKVLIHSTNTLGMGIEDYKRWRGG
jgi:succinate dehydrogenase hydrophobic anchor subunit